MIPQISDGEVYPYVVCTIDPEIVQFFTRTCFCRENELILHRFEMVIEGQAYANSTIMFSITVLFSSISLDKVAG